MTKALILVQKSNGDKKNKSLELTASLADTRTILTKNDFMAEGDEFIVHNAPVDTDDEDSILLNQVVGEDGSGTLLIGVVDSGLEAPDKSVARYKRLTDTQKLALFDNVEIYKGLTALPNKGFTRTFKPIIARWHAGDLPDSVKPSYVTHVTTKSSFSEITHSLATSSVDKASASLNTPYGGGQSSFEHEKKKSTKTSKVTEYLSGQFLVNKVDLKVDISKVQIQGDFEAQILAAVSGGSDIDQYDKLITVLNDRGYFIPIAFTLGGVLMSTSSTKIDKFEESESEKTEFSVGFKVAIDGFGGGGDYSHSEGRETTDSTTTKYTNLSITKKGGRADSKDYETWTQSLNPAINWDIINITELHPTLALLTNKRLLRYCLHLLETYYTYNTVKDKQAIINIGKYVTQTESILMSSGTGIGG